MNEKDKLFDIEDRLDVKRETKNNKRWITSFLLVASQAMICMGLFVALSGPMLQFLVRNTNSSVSQVSFASTPRTIGVCFGAMAFSARKNRQTDSKPLLTSGFALLTLSAVTISTPFMHSVFSLAVILALGGIANGYYSAGLQSFYLSKWGELGSRPYIQWHHFCFSIGAFLAPCIAKPFLELASRQQNPTQTCPSSYSNMTSPRNYANIKGPSSNPGPFDSETSAYLIIGSYMLLVSLLCLLFGFWQIEDRIGGSDKAHVETRPEKPIQEVWMFFTAVLMFKFFAIASEMLYQVYVYAVAICSDLKMDATRASLLTSLFWAGIGLGGLSAAITSNYIMPSTMIVADLVLATSSMVVIIIWGENSPTLIWIATFTIGLALSAVLPSGVSWSSGITNMTGKYIFVFTAGGTIGTAVMLPVGGVMFQIHPFSVMDLIAGTCVGTIVFFVLMNLAAKHLRRSDAGLR